ncbi:Zinc finger protein 2 [Eumeta japonica]|uniref:Zinc finger protein 2 n=1 Tax=Eumeta variegata TaxID=151549 RepID=A0A4C1T9L7_EUMVA|nr:Zinc finger protein 2 [Eumeta japonica]
MDLLKLSKTKANIDRNTPQSEKSAHINNMDLLMKYSNVMPFKGKNCHGIICYYCRGPFKDLEQLKEHVNKNHENVNLSDLLWRHGAESIVMYVDVTDLKCKLCDEGMHTLKALRTHLEDKHKKKLYKHVTDRVVPFKLASDRHECQICGFNFETFGTIERHMNNHFRNYVCKECGAGFISKYRLKVHFKNSHYNGSLHVCNVCKKEFFSAQKLKTHTQFVHKMSKRFRCPFCSERFNEYFKRQKHLVKEHGEAPVLYKCNVCFKEFDKRYSLSKHQKKDHLEERNFQCDKCTYRCFSRHELISHMVKHGGERIYECQVCKKAFARKKTLREHMRIHLDDKRFSCTVCGQSFIQKCSLKGHMKSQHPEYDVTN